MKHNYQFKKSEKDNPHQPSFHFDPHTDKVKLEDGPKGAGTKNPCTRYQKRLELLETDREVLIQGQILDPGDLYVIMDQLQNDAIPKIIAVYLDEENHMLGSEIVSLGQKLKDFDSGILYRLHLLLLAKQLILLVNHTNGDATPTQADINLIRKLLRDTTIVSFEMTLFDYVIVADKQYWSMKIQDGTACHCGKQRELV